MRGMLTGQVSKVHSNYRIPISNSASALLVLDNQARAALRKAGDARRGRGIGSHGRRAGRSAVTRG